MFASLRESIRRESAANRPGWESGSSQCRKLTVYDFFRELANLGGLLVRKHDCAPGWQSLWTGCQKQHVESEASD
jgi:hypothetical protein